MYSVDLKSLVNKETVIKRCHQPFVYLYYVLLTRVMHGKKSFMQRGTRVFRSPFLLKVPISKDLVKQGMHGKITVSVLFKLFIENYAHSL